ARRRRDEDALERRRAEQPIVRAAVQARAAGEAEVARTGPRVQPAGDLEERLLERALARGGEVRGVLEAAAAIGAAFRADPAFGAAIPEALTIAEDLAPRVGDRDRRAVDVERRQAERIRIAVRGETHDFSLVALARENRLRQQEVKHAEPDEAPIVGIPQLLAEATDRAAGAAAALGRVERRDLAPVARERRRARPGFREVPDRASLPVDDHHGGLVERRRV